MDEAAWPIPLLVGGLAMFSGATVLSSCASHGPAPASTSGLEPDEFWGEAEVIFEDAAFLWASIAGEAPIVAGNLLYGEGAGDSISTAFVSQSVLRGRCRFGIAVAAWAIASQPLAA